MRRDFTSCAAASRGKDVTRILIVLLAGAVLSACTSGTYYTSAAPSERTIVYGVDGNGNALRRKPGQVAPRASASQACLRYDCPPEAESR